MKDPKFKVGDDIWVDGKRGHITFRYVRCGVWIYIYHLDGSPERESGCLTGGDDLSPVCDCECHTKCCACREN